MRTDELAFCFLSPSPVILGEDAHALLETNQSYREFCDLANEIQAPQQKSCQERYKSRQGHFETIEWKGEIDTAYGPPGSSPTFKSACYCHARMLI